MNGVISIIKNEIKFDVFCINFDYLRMKYTAKLFQLKNDNYKELYLGSHYINYLMEIIDKNKYNIIHITHSGEVSARCIEAIKIKFPDIKLIYSCHSIAKYELKTRS